MQPSELAAGVVHVLFGRFKRHFSPQGTKAPDNPTSQLLPKISVEAVRRRQERQRRWWRIVGLKELYVKVFCVKELRVKKLCVCVWKVVCERVVCYKSCVVKGLFMTKPCVCVWERERECRMWKRKECERVVRVCVCEGVVCEQVVCERWETCVCVWCVCVCTIWRYVKLLTFSVVLSLCKRFGMLFSLQQVSAGGSGPLVSPLPTKLLMSCEDIGTDHPDVPAKTLPSDHGTWLTQEPPCRFQ